MILQQAVLTAVDLERCIWLKDIECHLSLKACLTPQ